MNDQNPIDCLQGGALRTESRNILKQIDDTSHTIFAILDRLHRPILSVHRSADANCRFLKGQIQDQLGRLAWRINKTIDRLSECCAKMIAEIKRRSHNKSTSEHAKTDSKDLEWFYKIEDCLKPDAWAKERTTLISIVERIRSNTSNQIETLCDLLSNERNNIGRDLFDAIHADTRRVTEGSLRRIARRIQRDFQSVTECTERLFDYLAFGNVRMKDGYAYDRSDGVSITGAIDILAELRSGKGVDPSCFIWECLIPEQLYDMHRARSTIPIEAIAGFIEILRFWYQRPMERHRISIVGPAEWEEIKKSGRNADVLRRTLSGQVHRYVAIALLHQNADNYAYKNAVTPDDVVHHFFLLLIDTERQMVWYADSYDATSVEDAQSEYFAVFSETPFTSYAFFNVCAPQQTAKDNNCGVHLLRNLEFYLDQANHLPHHDSLVSKTTQLGNEIKPMRGEILDRRTSIQGLLFDVMASHPCPRSTRETLTAPNITLPFLFGRPMLSAKSNTR